MAGPDLTGAVLDDRYQVIEPIAEGAMGAVYRGERLKLGRAVAIKIMHDALPDELASRGRFEREAKLMARLEHPHCVSVIDFGLHDGKPYLVMELVRGTSLLDVLAKSGRLEPPRAAELVKQVLSGLAHAHELGIVHRDIKPANIMLSERTGLGEQVQILDFGLARPAVDSTKLTTGIVVGTPNYMAPEQIKGGAIDARTDLYATGVMLFELVTGRKPFVADDPLAVVRKHLHAAPPTLADFGVNVPELEEVVAKAMAKQPAHRYASAAEMTVAIDQALLRRQRMADAIARTLPHRVAAATAGRAETSEGAGTIDENEPRVATPSGWNVPEGSVPADRALEGPPSSPSRAPAGPPLFEDIAPPAPEGPLFQSIAPPAPEGLPLFQSIAPPAPEGPPSFEGVALPAPAPRADRDVPPTRMLPLRGVPLTRKQLILGGGGLVLIVLVIVLVIVVATMRAGGHASARSSTPAAGSARPRSELAPVEPVAPALARASDLYANGDLEPALDVVTKARRIHPESAQLAFLGGRIYFAKLWWSDGAKAFRDAIRLDPAYRDDPELLKTVIRGFLTTPDADARIEALLRDLGDAARSALQETATTHPSAALRARAAATLRRLTQP